ncbi:MAG: ATP-dependent helicase, partial [Bacteroidetes bacterium]
MPFKTIGLNDQILKSINDLGFEKPTPIQAETIPHLLEDNDQDLLAFAQTGTGKTAAFGFPIIQKIDSNSLQTQSLILSPTRELCIQIAKDLIAYSKYIPKLNVVPVYGGTAIDTQIHELKKGAQIIVGTPGRTLDLIKRKRLKINKINWLVLDEADEMLNMGFKEDLDSILSQTPDTKKTLLFSATMPKDIKRIANTYMHNPKQINIGKKNSGAENVSHLFYLVKATDKYQALKRIADINPNIYGIVFCRTRRDTKQIAEQLIVDGYNADSLHGDLSQAQRDTVMQKFRLRNIQILVATDVAARGLDVNDLSHIINYNLPDDPEIYIHRSGRTGRAGKNGMSVSIIHSRELSKIKALEKMLKKTINREMVPTGDEIVEQRTFNLIENIKNTKVNEKQISPFLNNIFDNLSELSREELIKKFVSVEFTRFANYYKDAKDINYNSSSRQEKNNKSNNRQNRTQFTRFFINIGKRMDVNASTLIGIINENTNN